MLLRDSPVTLASVSVVSLYNTFHYRSAPERHSLADTVPSLVPGHHPYYHYKSQVIIHIINTLRDGVLSSKLS